MPMFNIHYKESINRDHPSAYFLAMPFNCRLGMKLEVFKISFGVVLFCHLCRFIKQVSGGTLINWMRVTGRY